MLLGEISEGWVVAGFTGAAAVVTVVFAGVLNNRKQKVEAENSRLTMLFAQYEGLVERVRKEHDQDRKYQETLQLEHTKCREENAMLKERVVSLEARVKHLEKMQENGK